LGWGLVPPAVVATGPFGQGSLQLFVEEDVEASIPVDSLRRMVLLDLIATTPIESRTISWSVMVEDCGGSITA